MKVKYKLQFFLIIILSFFIPLNIFGQMQDEAKINEGKAYIFAKNKLTSRKKYELSDTVVFLLNEYYGDSNWVNVSLPRNKFSKSVKKRGDIYDRFYISGFVEKSKIKLIDSLEPVKDTSIALIFYNYKVDTSKTINKTNMRYGLDIPLNISYEVRKLYLKWKGKLIKQDKILFDDLFNVASQKVYSSVENNRFAYYYHNGVYYIKQECADGAGFYEITWVIKNGKIIQRLIDDI